MINRRLWQHAADRAGFPVEVDTESASPPEVRLVGESLLERFTDRAPELLIGEKADDSDRLDKQVAESFEVELISPHKANRKRAKTQDGRKLRRQKRGWKIECLFAGLQNFRRIVVR